MDSLLEEPKDRVSWQKRLQMQLDRLLLESELDYSEVRNLVCRSDELKINLVEKSTGLGTIHRAAYDGQLDILRYCLDGGADVDSRTLIGRSPLHYACNGNRPSCVRLLLERKADANFRSLSLQTPLHMCCVYDSYEALLELINCAGGSLDLDAEDSKRKTAESLAKGRQIQRTLRKFRADLDRTREAELLEAMLRRLFNCCARNRSYMTSEDLATCQRVFKVQFPRGGTAGLEEELQIALHLNGHRLSYDGFRAVHTKMLQQHPEDHKDLLGRLNDLEESTFQSQDLKPQRDESADSFKLTPRPQQSGRRPSRTLLTGAKAILGLSLPSGAVEPSNSLRPPPSKEVGGA